MKIAFIKKTKSLYFYYLNFSLLMVLPRSVDSLTSLTDELLTNSPPRRRFKSSRSVMSNRSDWIKLKCSWQAFKKTFKLSLKIWKEILIRNICLTICYCKNTTYNACYWSWMSINAAYTIFFKHIQFKQDFQPIRIKTCLELFQIFKYVK